MSDFAVEYGEALGILADALAQDDYAVIGGLAVAFHGGARTTRDIDLLLAIPRIRLAPAMERLQERGFTFDLRGALAELRDDHLTQLHYRRVRVDLLDALLPVFREVVRLARSEEIQGRRLRIASPEGLLVLKLIAFREQDRADLWGLLAASRETLDRDLLYRLYSQVGDESDERWQTLERILRELG